ncbi:hypothetical protein ACQKFS_02595 [Pseudomonas guineae]|uniref:hypothetical protein n=1 Tax=Pseudomonas guineae TaxID=425504 RepID=UPI003D06B995
MLSVQVGGRWSKARPVSARPSAASWSATVPLGLEAQAAWRQAVVRDQAKALLWDKLAVKDWLATTPWGAAAQADGAQQAGPWNSVPAKDAGITGRWDHSIRPRDVRLRLIYNPKPARKDANVASPSRRVDAFDPRRDTAALLQASLYVPGNGPLAFNFGGRPYFPPTSPLVFFNFQYTPAKPRIQPVDSGGAVRWQDARRLNLQARLPWGRARVLDGPLTGIVYPDYSGPVKPLPVPPTDPEILETYMIANTVNLVVLPSRTPVEAKNVRIGWDADSFSWKFSADIFTQAALDLLKPDAGGAKEVELDINGWAWVLLVERYSRQLKFASEAYSISGATRTQLLAEPYAPLRTGLNAAPITALQAATEQLLYTGFTLEWDAQNVGPADWTFPAGTLSYQSQTAMQVIARIAETVGAIVRPARDSDALEIRPRYPVPPWEWGQIDAPIERIIPPAMMTQLNGDWAPQPAWNACYVSGTSNGVSMLVRRVGTAGDNPAPDVYDDWLTGEEANRARGVHELSKGGNIEIVGFTLPLFPLADDKGVGLVLPGMLCRVPEASGAWEGLCLAVDISATGTGSSRVEQQLKLERHH